jgi:hypothetical protein
VQRAAHVASLALTVLAVALATSRIGLIVHELVGHGVAALLSGGEVTGWRLHWFGGGWIAYDRDGGTLAAHGVQAAGIVSELVLAGVAALAARRTTHLARLAFGAAAWALAIHAGWYLAAGTFHGFGDGWRLHRALGDARLALVIPVGVAIVAAGYLAGRRVTAALRQLAPAATGRRQLGVVGLALALGLAGHTALTVAELRLTPDPTYQATMQTAGERRTAQEMSRRVDAAETAGRPLSAAEIAAARRDLERRHRQLPVGVVLVVAIGLAALAGVLRSAPAPDAAPPPPRAVAIVTTIAGLATLLVILVDRAAP